MNNDLYNVARLIRDELPVKTYIQVINQLHATKNPVGKQLVKTINEYILERDTKKLKNSQKPTK